MVRNTEQNGDRKKILSQDSREIEWSGVRERGGTERVV